MPITIRGASEHNLRGIDIEIPDGLTVVTGVSGSGKSSLAFDTLFHEARRRFLDIFILQSSTLRLNPAHVESIDGLLPAVSVAQNVLNRNPNSTVATATGIHPFLRLLYAHYGARVCTHCGEPVLLSTADHVAEQLLKMAERRSITLYAPLVRGVVGSHRTLVRLLSEEFGPNAIVIDSKLYDGHPLDPDLVHDIDLHIGMLQKNAHMVDVRNVIQMAENLGSSLIKGNEVMFAFAPVCIRCGEQVQDLSQSLFHQTCPYCRGSGCARCDETGIHPAAATTRWMSLRISDLLSLHVSEFIDVVGNADTTGGEMRLQAEILKRVRAVEKLGLGYLTLDRSSPSLSRGEAQRLRLSVCLASELEMLHVLDEPSIGLHPTDIDELFVALRNLSGPVVYVEHERAAAAAADFSIDIGPYAGAEGGGLVYSGTPKDLWNSDTVTGRFFSLRERVQRPAKLPTPETFISVTGAHINNLRDVDVTLPIGRMTVVSGVSGSGKTSLVQGVIASSFDRKVATHCEDIAMGTLSCIHVDQGPIGINPRSNPATYTKLADIIRDVFAKLTGLPASYFTFNRKEGACPVCKGLGAEEITMRYLPSSWIVCPVCDGKRFSEEVLGAVVSFGGQDLSIADIYNKSVDEVAELLLPIIDEHPEIISKAKQRNARAILQAMVDIGLGYLPLGQPSPTLSGGEAQRIKLTKFLGKQSLHGQLLILDEPSTGLHPADVVGLLSIFSRLTQHGTTLIIVEHNQDIIRAADWIVDLGPGAGPDGGSVLYQGEMPGLISCADSRTAVGLKREDEIVPEDGSLVPDGDVTEDIKIEGAAVNNLKGVSVDFKKGALTVVTGVSGSGKSSLVSGVLEHEARRRYLETLSMYERQSAKDSGTWAESKVTGLGVTVAVNPARGRYSLRSTIGTTSEIIFALSVLFAASHERICDVCGARMERGDLWSCGECGETALILQTRNFSRTTYASACTQCHGVGALRSFNPEKLIIRPDLPLCGGAMHSPGFFPKGYLCKPFNGGYDEVRALAGKYGFNPEITPWMEMSEKAQNAFLYGEDEPLEVTFRSKKGRVTKSIRTFHGFFKWIGDWDIGGTYTDTKQCSQCGGSGLRPESLAVKLNGKSIHELSELALNELQRELAEYKLSPDTSRHVASVYASALKRVDFLVKTGLRYVHLNRLDATLSAGEAQRVKLAGLLGSGLTRMTVLLDEPSRGMHPRELDTLVNVVTELRDEGNTVVVVEHEPMFIEAADRIVDMGPGAGKDGGQVVFCGDLETLRSNPAQSETGKWVAGLASVEYPNTRRKPTSHFTLKAPSANNLTGMDVVFPSGVLSGVCGVSGSGKSTLVVDTLGRLLAPAKQTTSVAYEPIEPGANEGIDAPPARTVIIDQARRGVRTPGVFLDLERRFAARYAESAEAAYLESGPKSFMRTCSACGGAGRIRLEMGFLPDVYSECDICDGTGYPVEADQVTLRGLTIPELSRSTLDELYGIWGDDHQIGLSLAESVSLGLGYLVFHQPAHTLSGGEAQRLKIVKELVKKGSKKTLYILDEPTVGQHLSDVSRLNMTLHRLVDEGNTVLVVEHHVHLLTACDWLIELGPGSGPDGGVVVAQGTPEQVAAGNTATAPYLRDVLERRGI